MACPPIDIYKLVFSIYYFIILDLSIISIISLIHFSFSALEGTREDVVGVQSELELFAVEVVGDGSGNM